MTSADPAISRTRGGTFNTPRNWQDFEGMARDLLERLYETVHIDLHGRPGQAQSGVDLFFTVRIR